MLLLLTQELDKMIKFIYWLLGQGEVNKLESNLKKYETNRKIHNNKKNRRRVKN